MSEHSWLIGKEFVDAHDSGNHVIRVVALSQSLDYVSVAVARHVDLGLTTRVWPRNAYAVTPLVLLHELTEAARPMIIDMIEREEDRNDSGEKYEDVTDVIVALNNVKEWQEGSAWRRS